MFKRVKEIIGNDISIERFDTCMEGSSVSTNTRIINYKNFPYDKLKSSYNSTYYFYTYSHHNAATMKITKHYFNKLQ